MNKFSKIFVVNCLLAVSILILTSCGGGGGGSDSPTKVVDNAMKVLLKGNYDAYIKHFDVGEATPAEVQFLVALIKGLNEEDPIVKYEIAEERIASSGETATVTMTVFHKSGKESTDNQKLVKTDKGWKMEVF